jgi:hypothetical protein
MSEFVRNCQNSSEFITIGHNPSKFITIVAYADMLQVNCDRCSKEYKIRSSFIRLTKKRML